ncbi:MAG TPA: hypothetical protein VI997_08460 [Candidatus Thermoplasmatota archaeon]|nr:hypothetical protein [Candidatus Thermoplasmatota archaeon]
MDRSLLGHVLLVAATVAWLVYSLLDGPGEFTLDLLIALAGFGLAAWAARADRPRFVGAGFLIAVLATVLFYDGDFTTGLAAYSGAVFAVGLAVAAVGAFADRARVVALGMWASAAGATMWIYADGVEGIGWQPGNVLAAVGAALVALGQRD